MTKVFVPLPDALSLDALPAGVMLVPYVPGMACQHRLDHDAWPRSVVGESAAPGGRTVAVAQINTPPSAQPDDADVEPALPFVVEAR